MSKKKIESGEEDLSKRNIHKEGYNWLLEKVCQLFLFLSAYSPYGYWNSTSLILHFLVDQIGFVLVLALRKDINLFDIADFSD